MRRRQNVRPSEWTTTRVVGNGTVVIRILGGFGAGSGFCRLYLLFLLLLLPRRRLRLLVRAGSVVYAFRRQQFSER